MIAPPYPPDRCWQMLLDSPPAVGGATHVEWLLLKSADIIKCLTGLSKVINMCLKKDTEYITWQSVHD